MRNPFATVVASIAVGTAAAIGVAPAAESEPVLVDSFGQWKLARLGGAPLEFSGSRRGASKSIMYRLPAGARQGPKRWYLLRLRFEAEIAPTSGPGSIFVDGSTNGRTAVSVELEIVKEDGRFRVVMKTLDLTRGAGRDVTFGRQVDGTSVSFFQNRGVRPGINRLTFGVEQYGDVELRRARILGDSGLIVSRRSPARLRLEPRLPRKTLEVGGKAKLGYQVSNTGDRPLMDVVVAMQSHHEALRVRGPSQVRIGRLGQSRTGHFLIEAHRPGRRRLTLAASSSNANNPVVELEVNVPRADQKTSSVGMGLILAGALLGVVGVGVLGYSAARRSARGRPS